MSPTQNELVVREGGKGWTAQGKMTEENLSGKTQGKHRELEILPKPMEFRIPCVLAKFPNILFAQFGNSMIPEIKDIAIFVRKVTYFFLGN